MSTNTFPNKQAGKGLGIFSAMHALTAPTNI